jgi:hypothetical protein
MCGLRGFLLLVRVFWLVVFDFSFSLVFVASVWLAGGQPVVKFFFSFLGSTVTG